jgi:hypothetical protein
LKGYIMDAKFTQTNGNATNHIRGGRIRVYLDGVRSYQATIPSKYGAYHYMTAHPGSKYTVALREWMDAHGMRHMPIPCGSITFTAISKVGAR